jgi:hypothetical protein
MYGVSSVELQVNMSPHSYILGKVTKHCGEVILILLPVEEVLSLNLLGNWMPCLGFRFALVLVYKDHL